VAGPALRVSARRLGPFSCTLRSRALQYSVHAPPDRPPTHPSCRHLRRPVTLAPMKRCSPALILLSSTLRSPGPPSSNQRSWQQRRRPMRDGVVCPPMCCAPPRPANFCPGLTAHPTDKEPSSTTTPPSARRRAELRRGNSGCARRYHSTRVPSLRNEARDGYDTSNGLPPSPGRMARSETFGLSYPGACPVARRVRTRRT